MITRVHLSDKCFLVVSLLEVGLLRMVAAQFEKKEVWQGNGHGTEKDTSHLLSLMCLEGGHMHGHERSLRW
jgi:hypothetical protein